MTNLFGDRHSPFLQNLEQIAVNKPIQPLVVPQKRDGRASRADLPRVAVTRQPPQPRICWVVRWEPERQKGTRYIIGRSIAGLFFFFWRHSKGACLSFTHPIPISNSGLGGSFASHRIASRHLAARRPASFAFEAHNLQQHLERRHNQQRHVPVASSPRGPALD